MANQYNVKRREELEQFLNLVAEQILQNEMSLFIGAGSSMQYGAMNWSDLINSVYSGLDNWDDTDRAQYAELTGVNVKSKICQKLFELNLNSESNNTYLNHLLDFDFKSIWTTNYDNLIEKVLERKTKRYKAIYQYKHFKLLSYPRGSFLFKINGSQTNEESIVITHEDFINYRKSHEGFLILLKRELLCNSFLFLGCSFDDDILRICIKDILNCIDNNGDNYTTNHFAIIAEKDNFKSDYICKDLINHYKINCLKVNQPELSYLISMALMYKVKFNSIFISVSGENEMAIEAMKTLKNKGTYIVSITKLNNNTLARLADKSLYVITDQYKRFNNRTYETTSAYFNTVEILFLKYLDYLDNLDE